MSGMKPSFVTGEMAKIKIGGKTLAYAQDISYNVTVTTIPIETMGRYEVVSNEPVAFFVDGSLSVVRYTKEAAKQQGTNSTAVGLNAQGNSSEQMGAGAMFNPGEMLGSTTFDLEIFQKIASSGTIGTETIIKLRDCRFTRMGGAINKRGILVEQFSFNAILINNDSVETSHSGDSDLSA